MTARKKSARKRAPRADQEDADAERRQLERESTPNHPDNVKRIGTQPVDANTVRATE